MGSKLKYLGVLMAGLVVGFFVFYILGFISSLAYQPIINRITVKDTTHNVNLTPTYLGSTVGKFEAPTLQFTVGNTYSGSIWSFNRVGDPEVICCVWGPGDDGKTYQVEMASYGLSSFQVYVDGSLKYTLANLGDFAVFDVVG